MAISYVYEKQYIRFANTYTAPVNKQTVGAGSDLAVGEFCVVHRAPYAGAGYAAAGNAFNTQPTEVLGVNQAAVDTAAAAPEASRLMTVAESGKLLVRISPDNTADLIPGSFLAIDALGRAQTRIEASSGVSASGKVVTIGGKNPVIEAHLKTGGEEFALVSF